MSPNPSIQTPLLLAEDEQGDVFMFRHALGRSKLNLPLFVVGDGEEVVAYLSGEPPYADRTKYPLPALMVLDLKMPRMSGFDVLSWLSEHPNLNQIPAVILSSSSYDDDIRKASQLGARDYFIKPSTTSELAKLIQSMAERWLSTNAGAT